MAERAERNPYKQFSPGQSLDFTLHTLNPDRSICLEEKRVELSSVKSGGFFGRVLIPEGQDFVIKTSVPDPWHDFWRRANWGFREFPSQVSETQAKLDFLATNLIADVLPTITNDRFYAPHSLGYTKLSNGYAQVIERVNGRGPRFDTADNEYESFRQAQPVLTSTGLNLGLEHTAQIHTDNPFGMANLWFDEGNNQWIWLDTLPAIPHKGWIWPLFYFRFHKDVRHWFYPETDAMTFNRVHSDMFLQEIQNSRYLFDENVYQQVLDSLNLYQVLWEERRHQSKTPRNFGALGLAALESGKILPTTILDIGRTLKTTVRAIFDANLRRILVNDLVLAGTKKALEEGVISNEEYQEAKLAVEDPNPRTISKRTLPVLTGVYGYYQGSSIFLLKPTELASYAYLFGSGLADRLVELDLTPLLSQENVSEKLAIFGSTFLAFRVIGGLNTYIGTKVLGRLSSMDLDTAAKISVIPIIGSHLAIPAQIGVTATSGSDLIWHYSVRYLVAKISSIFPPGGWGTQYEGILWRWLGKHLEKLATSKN
ncbi:MAG: hypothetical protein AAB414_00515 [Patescibacteria group bacterium]